MKEQKVAQNSNKVHASLSIQSLKPKNELDMQRTTNKPMHEILSNSYPIVK